MALALRLRVSCTAHAVHCIVHVRNFFRREQVRTHAYTRATCLNCSKLCVHTERSAGSRVVVRRQYVCDWFPVVATRVRRKTDRGRITAQSKVCVDVWSLSLSAAVDPHVSVTQRAGPVSYPASAHRGVCVCVCVCVGTNERRADGAAAIQQSCPRPAWRWHGQRRALDGPLPAAAAEVLPPGAIFPLRSRMRAFPVRHCAAVTEKCWWYRGAHGRGVYLPFRWCEQLSVSDCMCAIAQASTPLLPLDRGSLRSAPLQPSLQRDLYDRQPRKKPRASLWKNSPTHGRSSLDRRRPLFTSCPP
jgi:hypothetical protein